MRQYAIVRGKFRILVPVSPPDLTHLCGLLVDLDGVVYTGEVSVPGAAAFLAEARRRSFPLLMVTNNSTSSSEAVVTRLASMGIRVEPGQVLTSAQAAASFIHQTLPSVEQVFVIGELGLREAVLNEGLRIVDDAAGAECVLVGLDRAFTYAKLAAATRAILGGAPFVATNADALLPVEGGGFLPGAGTMVAAISAATGILPTVIGKPEAALFQEGLARLGGFAPHDVAMVGDRLDTDLDGARRVGLRTILVLSGVATRADAEGAAQAPDAVVPSLIDVASLLQWDTLA